MLAFALLQNCYINEVLASVDRRTFIKETEASDNKKLKLTKDKNQKRMIYFCNYIALQPLKRLKIEKRV